MTLTRRHVLAAAAASALLPLSRETRADGVSPLKAAVIGHTGWGEYGHGMDVAFTGVPGVTVVAVADQGPEAGRAKAAARAGKGQAEPPRLYADYRQMLAEEKPDVVSVAPRWSDHHKEMALAAIAAGAHLYMEKPIAVSPAECDAIVAAADKANRKVAVAHQMRLAPSVVFLKQKVDAGLIGDLLEMRAYGKQDARAGGEDLLVLGVHLFDLMRLFAGGDPLAVTARVTDKGRDITKADARKIKEQIGLVAGDEVTAQFAFANGLNGSFTSRGRLKDHAGWWGVELVGSKGSARILADIVPSVAVLSQSPWKAGERQATWSAIPGDPGRAEGFDKSTDAANRRLVDDLLAAIKENREPTCSGRNAAWGVEMVMGVHRAALGNGRATFPLADRSHPLV